MAARLLLATCLVLAWAVVLGGCSKKADESKSLAAVKAEAERMDAGELRSMALKYKEAMEAKQAEVDKLAAKLKEIPLTEALGKEAKALKSDMEELKKSVSALKERMDVYVAKLKEKGGDTSGL